MLTHYKHSLVIYTDHTVKNIVLSNASPHDLLHIPDLILHYMSLYFIINRIDLPLDKQNGTRTRKGNEKGERICGSCFHTIFEPFKILILNQFFFNC